MTIGFHKLEFTTHDGEVDPLNWPITMSKCFMPAHDGFGLRLLGLQPPHQHCLDMVLVLHPRARRENSFVGTFPGALHPPPRATTQTSVALIHHTARASNGGRKQSTSKKTENPTTIEASRERASPAAGLPETSVAASSMARDSRSEEAGAARGGRACGRRCGG